MGGETKRKTERETVRETERETESNAPAGAVLKVASRCCLCVVVLLFLFVSFPSGDREGDRE